MITNFHFPFVIFQFSILNRPFPHHPPQKKGPFRDAA
jgi:hypothetical protein